MSSAGQFRDCVIVQDPADTPDGRGGFARTFADSTISFFARILRKHFAKRLESGKLETGIEYFVTIKEEPAATIMESRLKIDADGRILKIMSMKPTQDLDETEFRCVEVPIGG